MTVHRRSVLAGLGGCLTVGVAGCTGLGAESDGVSGDRLRVTTTTSTYDTGLLDELASGFEARFGATVQAIAQGTGAALETARRGDADAVLVHARALEDAFLEDGYGINRRDVFANDFLLVGEPADPAGVAGLDVLEALERIADTSSRFVSRGDRSGTHARELELWAAADIEERDEWYREAGSGMGMVLVQTDRDGGYTLADRGTYLSMRADLDLAVHVEDDGEWLANPYGIVAVDPARHDHVAYDLAMAFIGFLTGPEGQAIVGAHEVDGEQLFVPTASGAFDQYVPEGWES